jgi:uncharacterized lipoprotein NlpE involved in copper resistance
MLNSYNKENIEMRASSSGNPNTNRVSASIRSNNGVQFNSQFNTTQGVLPNTNSNLNKTTSFLSAAGVTMANSIQTQA